MVMEMGFSELFMINPPIISVLIFSSILFLTYFIERFYCYLRTAPWSEEFWKRLRAAVQAGRFHEARTMCASSKNVYARVFYVIINNTHLNRADAEDMAQIEKENMLEDLRKRLGVFSTLSFISPLIGLLGTVTGIMRAFADLGRSGSGGANIVAAGIAEALITTAAGIIVAVPAAVVYNFFTYRLRSISLKMNNFSQELLILIYGGEETGSKAAQPKASDIRAKSS